MICRITHIAILLPIVLLLTLAAGPARAYEDIGVSVRIKGQKSFKIKKQLEQMARKEAVSNYIRRVNPAIAGKSCEKQIIDSRASLIRDITNQDTTQVGDYVEGSYLVRIDDEKSNCLMEELNCGVQSGHKEAVILIMEETPSKADMSLILSQADAGTTRKLRGLGPFVLFYTSYQRAIRDAIIAKANREGLSLTRLDTVDEFKRMKVSHDDPVVGVYFDADNEDFALNNRLVRAVKKKYADEITIILYYRISSLYFDQVKRELKAEIAISVLNLNDNITKSVGSQEFMVMIPKGQPSIAIRDGLSEVAENAASLLMNDAKKVVRKMITMAQHKDQPVRSGEDLATVTLRLNSKRTMFKVKKGLSADSVRQSSIQNGALIIKLAPEISPDNFVFEELLSQLQSMGINIPDENIELKGREVLIKQ